MWKLWWTGQVEMERELLHRHEALNKERSTMPILQSEQGEKNQVNTTVLQPSSKPRKGLFFLFVEGQQFPLFRRNM
jgi:hypothetical protein